MAANRLNERSLRPAEHLLVWAFVISLIAHLVAYGGFKLGNRLGWWNHSFLPAWLKTTQQALAEAKKNKPKPVEPPQLVPLEFVEVDPAAITAEPPKNAKYYSSKNSKAANPDTTLDTDTPKFDGKQTRIVKTEDAPRSHASPLQPSAPKNEKPEPEQPEAKAKLKGGKAPGDLAMAKTSPSQGEDGQAEKDPGMADVPKHHRPRTLEDAHEQLREAHMLPGEKMKQDGGVRRHLQIGGLDTVATPFGEYDLELIEAIQNRWYQLLDEKGYAYDQSGKVVVEFHLKYDGRVTDVHIVERNVSEIFGFICQRAIEEPAPFAPWPSDMRRFINADFRDITFTFYYQ
jgi:hypothetical protein